MASSWVPSSPRAYASNSRDNSIQSPPSPRASEPWRDAILKTRNSLDRDMYPTIRQGGTTRYRDERRFLFAKNSGRCISFDPYATKRNHVLSALLQEVIRLKLLTGPNASVESHYGSVGERESCQLRSINLLIESKYKTRSGLLRPGSEYMPGAQEKEDSKLVIAALLYIQDAQTEVLALQRRECQALSTTNSAPKPAKLLYKRTTQASRSNQFNSTSWPPPNTIVATPLPPLSTKDINLQPPATIVAKLHPPTHPPTFPLTHPTTFPRPQPRQVLRRYTSRVSEKTTQPTATSNLPLPLANKPLDFGNRIEQALLKMDKWADAWLAGEMGDSDLAWQSFEYCLCMPDILEAGEVMDVDKFN